MQKALHVDCSFDKEGTVHIRRIAIEDSWFVVEPGRQWLDEFGRHVLIIIPGGRVLEIVLSPETLIWTIISDRTQSNIL